MTTTTIEVLNSNEFRIGLRLTNPKEIAIYYSDLVSCDFKSGRFVRTNDKMFLRFAFHTNHNGWINVYIHATPNFSKLQSDNLNIKLVKSGQPGLHILMNKLDKETMMSVGMVESQTVKRFLTETSDIWFSINIKNATNILLTSQNTRLSPRTSPETTFEVLNDNLIKIEWHFESLTKFQWVKSDEIKISKDGAIHSVLVAFNIDKYNDLYIHIFPTIGGSLAINDKEVSGHLGFGSCVNKRLAFTDNSSTLSSKIDSKIFRSYTDHSVKIFVELKNGPQFVQ